MSMIIPIRKRDAIGMVRECIAPLFPEARDIHEDTDIISCGILDSLNIVRFVAYLQEVFGETLTSEDITSRNFRTISGIAKIMRGKKNADRI